MEYLFGMPLFSKRLRVYLLKIVSEPFQDCLQKTVHWMSNLTLEKIEFRHEMHSLSLYKSVLLDSTNV